MIQLVFFIVFSFIVISGILTLVKMIMVFSNSKKEKRETDTEYIFKALDTFFKEDSLIKDKILQKIKVIDQEIENLNKKKETLDDTELTKIQKRIDKLELIRKRIENLILTSIDYGADTAYIYSEFKKLTKDI